MTAARPRVSVVLDQDVVETLRRVAAVQRRSVSSVVAELVTELEPGLRQVADIGQLMEAVRQQQLASMRRVAELMAAST